MLQGPLSWITHSLDCAAPKMSITSVLNYVIAHCRTLHFRTLQWTFLKFALCVAITSESTPNSHGLLKHLKITRLGCHIMQVVCNLALVIWCHICVDHMFTCLHWKYSCTSQALFSSHGSVTQLSAQRPKCRSHQLHINMHWYIICTMHIYSG